jgi:nucleoside-diphosphate-sugar epimerase
VNFLRLMQWIDRGRVLPLGSVENRRSLLYVENLASAIVACIQHPAAAGETFLIDDGTPISTPALVRALARALGRPARLVPFPVALLRAAAAVLGYRDACERLCGNFELSSSKLRAMLGWAPPWLRETGLRATVDRYRAAQPASDA